MSKEIEVARDVLQDNTQNAVANRQRFGREGVYVVNLMSGPGAGKTTLLERTAEALGKRVRMAVITGDIATTRDADRIGRHGVPALQINTGGACHIEAHQIARAADDLKTGKLDLLIIENVGNLVCPAEFESGRARQGDDAFLHRRPRQAGQVPAHVPGVAPPSFSIRWICSPTPTSTWRQPWPTPVLSTPPSKSSRCRPGRARVCKPGSTGCWRAWQPPGAPNMDPRQGRRILVSGVVQGVGFGRGCGAWRSRRDWRAGSSMTAKA